MNPEIMSLLRCECGATLRKTRMCRNGHTVCSKCAQKFLKCTICNCDLKKTVNYIIQDLVEKHFDNEVKHSSEDKVKVSTSKSYKIICPIKSCKVQTNNLRGHIEGSHEPLIYFNRFHYVRQSTFFYVPYNIHNTYIRLVRVSGYIFVILVKVVPKKACCYVQVGKVSDSTNKKKFIFKVNNLGVGCVVNYENFHYCSKIIGQLKKGEAVKVEIL